MGQQEAEWRPCPWVDTTSDVPQDLTPLCKTGSTTGPSSGNIRTGGLPCEYGAVCSTGNMLNTTPPITTRRHDTAMIQARIPFYISTAWGWECGVKDLAHNAGTSTWSEIILLHGWQSTPWHSMNTVTCLGSDSEVGYNERRTRYCMRSASFTALPPLLASQHIRPAAVYIPWRASCAVAWLARDIACICFLFSLGPDGRRRR